MMKPPSNIKNNSSISKNKSANRPQHFINTSNLNDKPVFDMFRTPNAAVFTNTEYHNLIQQNSAPKSLKKFQNKSKLKGDENNKRIQEKQNITGLDRQRINSCKTQHASKRRQQRKNILTQKNNSSNCFKRPNSQRFLTNISEKTNENRELMQYKQALRNQSKFEKSNSQKLPAKVFLSEVVQKMQILNLLQSEYISYDELVRFLYSMCYISFPTQEEYKTQASKEELKKVYLLWISLMQKIDADKNNKDFKDSEVNKFSLKKCRVINVIIFAFVLQALPVCIDQIRSKIKFGSRLKNASSKKLMSYPSSQIENLFRQQNSQGVKQGDPQFIFFVQKRKFKFNEEGIALLQLQRQRIVNQFNGFIKTRMSSANIKTKKVSDFLCKLQSDGNQVEDLNQKGQGPFTNRYQRQDEIEMDKQQSEEDSECNYYYGVDKQPFEHLQNCQVKRNFVQSFKRQFQERNGQHRGKNSQAISGRNNHLKQDKMKKLKANERPRSRSHSNQKDLDLVILSRPKAKSRTKTSDQVQFQRQAKQYTFHPKVKQNKAGSNNSKNCNQNGQAISKGHQQNLHTQQVAKISQKETVFNKIKHVEKTIMRMHEARNIKQQKQELQKKGWTRGSKLPQQQSHNKIKQKQRRKIVISRNTHNMQQSCFKQTKNVQLQNKTVHLHNVNETVSVSQLSSQRAMHQKSDLDCNSKLLITEMRKLLGNQQNSNYFSPKLNNVEKQKFDTQHQQKEEKKIVQEQSKQLPIFNQVLGSLRSKNEQFRIPILYIDVNIEQGKKERIVIYDGDKSQDLAQAFGKKHDLDGQTVGRLEQMLQQQINSVLSRIDEQTEQDSFIG